MKKKKTAKPRTTITVAIPTELMSNFRKTCINLDYTPHLVINRILKQWIDKNRKKVEEPRVSNG